jgi:AcrR family transcriptional regulator
VERARLRGIRGIRGPARHARGRDLRPVLLSAFRGKDALLLELLRDEMARAAARLRAATAKAETPQDQVANWIRGIIKAADDSRRVARARLLRSLPALMREFPVETR